MNPLIRALVVAASLIVAPLALAAELSGKWTSSFESQVGTQTYTFEFKVQGGALTGTAKSNLLGDNTLESGKVDGNKVAFVEKAKYQGMDLTITYTGEVVGNDEIHFKRDVAGFGMEDMVAKRSK